MFWGVRSHTAGLVDAGNPMGLPISGNSSAESIGKATRSRQRKGNPSTSISKRARDCAVGRLCPRLPIDHIPGFGGRPHGFNARNGKIAEFASVLQSQFMELPVVDPTGLGETRYNFIPKWTPDPAQSAGFGGGPPPGAAPPPVPADDAPPEVMVIDKVDKPSKNQ